jgi:hypothetical protein
MRMKYPLQGLGAGFFSCLAGVLCGSCQGACGGGCGGTKCNPCQYGKMFIFCCKGIVCASVVNLQEGTKNGCERGFGFGLERGCCAFMHESATECAAPLTGPAYQSM